MTQNACGEYFYDNGDLDILARTLFGEARGEYVKKDAGLGGLICVANVIVNRWRHHKRRFGTSIRAVCLQPFQFSCWNVNDPNLAIIRNITAQDPVFNVCKRVATHVVKALWPDLTQGCDHYHSVAVHPTWAYGKRHMLKMGRHVFYKLEGR